MDIEHQLQSVLCFHLCSIICISVQVNTNTGVCQERDELATAVQLREIVGSTDGLPVDEDVREG